MKVLVIGGGGREHALVWRLKESSRVDRVVCAPGNGGILAEAECVAADAGNVAGPDGFSARIGPDPPIVGPAVPPLRGFPGEFPTANWCSVGPVTQDHP